MWSLCKHDGNTCMTNMAVHGHVHVHVPLHVCVNGHVPPHVHGLVCTGMCLIMHFVVQHYVQQTWHKELIAWNPILVDALCKFVPIGFLDHAEYKLHIGLIFQLSILQLLPFCCAVPRWLQGYIESGLFKFTYGSKDNLVDFLHGDNFCQAHIKAAEAMEDSSSPVVRSDKKITSLCSLGRLLVVVICTQWHLAHIDILSLPYLLHSRWAIGSKVG